MKHTQAPQAVGGTEGSDNPSVPLRPKNSVFKNKKKLLLIVICVLIVGGAAAGAVVIYQQHHKSAITRPDKLTDMYSRLAKAKTAAEKAPIQFEIGDQLRYLSQYQSAIDYYTQALNYYQKATTTADKTRAATIRLAIDFCKAQLKAAEFVEQNKGYYNRGKQSNIDPKKDPIRTD